MTREHSMDGDPAGAWGRFRGELQTEVRAGLLEHLGRLSWSAEQIGAAQRSGLRRVLAHAVAHSPYHARRLAGVDVETIDLTNLPELPVMTKADMMDAFDQVVTDRHVNRAMIERALASTDSTPVPIDGRYVAYATGGSSGTRGVFAFDVPARAAFVLSLLRPVVARLRRGATTPAAGGPAGGLSIAIVAAASPIHASGSIAAAADQGGLPVQINQIPVTLPLAEIVQQLNDLQAPVLVGYPSMLGRLAEERRCGRLTISPIAITATGETLEAQVRDAITESFGTPVVNTFASTEGLVGSSAPGDGVLVFNDDMCIVELVDASNRPVPPGVPSAKVLLTNLHNLFQPLIRYELNDMFIRRPDASDHGHLRAVVGGRADEVLRYRELDVHPHVVRSILLHTPQILDYQVRQAPDGIDLDVIAQSEADLDAVGDQLVQALERTGLVQPLVRITPVAQLPRHPHTGKVSRFVPLAS